MTNLLRKEVSEQGEIILGRRSLDLRIFPSQCIQAHFVFSLIALVKSWPNGLGHLVRAAGTTLTNLLGRSPPNIGNLTILRRAN